MRSSVGQRFETTVSKCDICFDSYDRRTHAPVIICSMHHTVCKDCLEAIREKPQCPFCRESIRMDKLTINNYIFELLPGNQPPPEVRMEQQYFFPPEQPFQFDHPPMQNYGPNRLSQYQQMSINRGENQLVAQAHEWEPQELGGQDAFWHCILLIIIGINIPLAVMDLYMGLGKYESCQGQDYNKTVRSWFLGIGIVECSIIGVIFLLQLLFKGTCLSKSYFTTWLSLAGLAIVMKTLYWAVVEIILFARVIAPSCSSLPYGYGLFLTILHGLLLLSALFVIRSMLFS